MRGRAGPSRQGHATLRCWLTSRHTWAQAVMQAPNWSQNRSRSSQQPGQEHPCPQASKSGRGMASSHWQHGQAEDALDKDQEDAQGPRRYPLSWPHLRARFHHCSHWTPGKCSPALEGG